MGKHAATPAWSRRIGWRQGHILPEEAVSALRLGSDADTLVMVVSHDCDLANTNLDIEPFVEVITGTRLPAQDGVPSFLLPIFPVGMAYLAAVGVRSPLQPTESDRVSVCREIVLWAAIFTLITPWRRLP